MPIARASTAVLSRRKSSENMLHKSSECSMHIMQYSEYEVNRPLFKGPSRPASTYSLPELSKINKISQLDNSYSYYSIGPSSWGEMKAKVQLMLLRKRKKLKKMFSFDQDDHDQCWRTSFLVGILSVFSV